MPFVPAQPILNYIADLGGLHNLPGITGMVVTIEPEEDGAGDWSRRKRERTHVVRDLEERRTFKNAEKTIERLEKSRKLELVEDEAGEPVPLLSSGRVTLDKADDFCIIVLGVHPCVVYGEAWFGYIADAVAGMADETDELEAVAA